MATERTIKVSDFTKMLSKEEKAFLKDTIKKSIKKGCVPTYTKDAGGNVILGNLISYTPTADSHKMLKAIWDKMAENNATLSISFSPVTATIDVLLISVEDFSQLKKWTRR